MFIGSADHQRKRKELLPDYGIGRQVMPEKEPPSLKLRCGTQVISKASGINCEVKGKRSKALDFGFWIAELKIQKKKNEGQEFIG
jgi:hypothetical protein